MNFNFLLFILFFWTITSNSMQNKYTGSYWNFDPKSATTTERAFEEDTQKKINLFRQNLTKIHSNNPQKKTMLTPDISNLIQNQFKPIIKQLTEENKQQPIHSEQKEKIIDNNSNAIDRHQKLLLINQQLKESVKKQENIILELKSEQKKIKNARKRARQKAKKQQQQKALNLATKKQPSLDIVTNKPTNKPLAPQKSVHHKKLIALKILFRKHNVKKEADLKNKFNRACSATNQDYFEDRINESCTFEYYADTNELEIFTDDYEDETSSDEISDSSNDLEINVTVLRL